jgi:hypothetical protein
VDGICLPYHFYDTNMVPKVVCGKTVLVKFKINNNFKQNIEETHSKQPEIHRKFHTNLWILDIICEPKGLRLLPNVGNF